MRPLRPLAIAAAVCAALLVAAPAVASGAAAVPTSATVTTATIPATPLAKRAPEYDVQLWLEPASAALLVNATLPTSTPLPARVRVPLLAGATIDWIGEILGGSPEQDPSVPYRLIESGTVVETVLTKSRVLQYEATLGPPSTKGDMLTSSVEWVQSTPASAVRFAVRASTGIRNVSVTPAPTQAPQINAAGERLYVVDARTMKQGEKATLQAVFQAGAESGSSPDTGGSSSTQTVVGALVAAVVIVAVALLIVIGRQRRSPHRR